MKMNVGPTAKLCVQDPLGLTSIIQFLEAREGSRLCHQLRGKMHVATDQAAVKATEDAFLNSRKNLFEFRIFSSFVLLLFFSQTWQFGTDGEARTMVSSLTLMATV